MTKLLPKELVHATELMDQAKLDKALEIVENFEKNESLTQEVQLSTLLIKGGIYLYKQRTRKALQTFEIAYQMSQTLELVFESIEALIGKAYIGVIGDLDKASTYVLDAERRLNSLANEYSIEMLRRNLLLIKSWILLFKGNIKEAAESSEKCLRLTEEEKLGNKLDLATTYLLLGYVILNQGNRPKALEYAMKSLEHNKELNHAIAIADDFVLIATIYYYEGDYDKALQYCKQSLSIKEITGRSKLDVLWNLGQIYRLKNDMNRALKYRQQAVVLAEELNIPNLLIRNLAALGYLYRLIGKSDLALEYAERILTLSEKLGLIFWMSEALQLFILTYTEEKSPEKAYRYFSRLTELYNRTKDKGEVDISDRYLVSKAYMMKTSTRMRDRAEAQELFKELIDRTSGDSLIFNLGSLCDLLLEELSIYNDPEILDEIMPLVTKSLEMAEEAHNYAWLANTKLLQAKLALIQMNIEEAKKLMVQAQRIAELHGLNLLASRISSEHDKLLEQIDVWDTVKKEEAPISERIKLAATNEVLERIQGKRAVEPPKLDNEQPVLILIIAEGGTLIFSNIFIEEFQYEEDLISGFLSAFNTFSGELFSKGLDRAKFGEYTILMESINSFSFCYLYKGQTYLARQKLTKFVKEMQENTSLWQNLERHYKTSQILELKDSPILENLITDIFLSQKN